MPRGRPKKRPAETTAENTPPLIDRGIDDAIDRLIDLQIRKELAGKVEEQRAVLNTVRNLRVRPVVEPVGMVELVALSNQLGREEDRALFYCLYLTAGRIGEALRLTTQHFYDYEKDENGQTILRYAVKLPTEKNRRTWERDIPLVAKSPQERYMLDKLTDFVNKRSEQGKGEPIYVWAKDNKVLIAEKLERNSPEETTELHRREKLRKLFAKRFRSIKFMATQKDLKTRTASFGEVKLFPHYLRHCRLTHLTERERLTEHELMAFAGWSDPRPSGTYVHLTLERLR